MDEATQAMDEATQLSLLLVLAGCCGESMVPSNTTLAKVYKKKKKALILMQRSRKKPEFFTLV